MAKHVSETDTAGARSDEPQRLQCCSCRWSVSQLGANQTFWEGARDAGPRGHLGSVNRRSEGDAVVVKSRSKARLKSELRWCNSWKRSSMTTVLQHAPHRDLLLSWSTQIDRRDQPREWPRRWPCTLQHGDEHCAAEAAVCQNSCKPRCGRGQLRRPGQERWQSGRTRTRASTGMLGLS